jgi:aspartate kinase
MALYTDSFFTAHLMSASDADVSFEAEPPRVVFKFGGTSVGTADRFQTVIDIIRHTAKAGRVLAVVSAQGKVTRRLSAGMETFVTQFTDRSVVVDTLVRDLRERHLAQARDVLSDESRATYVDVIDDRLEALREVFASVEREGFTPAARDAVLATGEQLSVPMVTLALRDQGLDAPFCDATALVVTDDTFGEAHVHREATAERVRSWYDGLSPDAVPVVAGFIGATADGTTTTLGFEGSDYSAALFAQMLSAECLTRYTDVDGLYSDDPASNQDADRLDEISMEQAFALTESGRLGMHPKTLRPLVEANIPMQVRSIDVPDGTGTRIIPRSRENVRVTPSVGAIAPAPSSG